MIRRARPLIWLAAAVGPWLLIWSVAHAGLDVPPAPVDLTAVNAAIAAAQAQASAAQE